MKAVSQQARQHQRAVQKKTMRRRGYKRVLKAIFTPLELASGRHANAHQEARRSSWARSFKYRSPIAAALHSFWNKLAEKIKAKKARGVS